jgi:hypothetical protein
LLRAAERERLFRASDFQTLVSLLLCCTRYEHLLLLISCCLSVLLCLIKVQERAEEQSSRGEEQRSSSRAAEEQRSTAEQESRGFGYFSSGARLDQCAIVHQSSVQRSRDRVSYQSASLHCIALLYCIALAKVQTCIRGIQVHRCIGA